jgi:hypothetical protein
MGHHQPGCFGGSGQGFIGGGVVGGGYGGNGVAAVGGSILGYSVSENVLLEGSPTSGYFQGQQFHQFGGLQQSSSYEQQSGGGGVVVYQSGPPPNVVQVWTECPLLPCSHCLEKVFFVVALIVINYHC